MNSVLERLDIVWLVYFFTGKGASFASDTEKVKKINRSLIQRLSLRLGRK